MSLSQMVELRKELAAVTEELAETKKDYQCLASLLDGHDATECRMNLVRLAATKQQLADALFDKEQAINKQAECMKAADNAEQQLAAVTKQRDELQEWKESAMQVGSSWDAQAIGELIGVPIGCAILPQIEPAIRKLIAQRDILKAGLEEIATGAWCIKKCVDVIAPRALAQANSTAAKGGES